MGIEESFEKDHGQFQPTIEHQDTCHTLIIIDLHSLASSFLDPTIPPIQLMFAWNCVAFFIIFLIMFLIIFIIMTHDDMIPDLSDIP